MLPDEKIMCHRTGFEKSCFDMVTKGKCRLWVQVQGTHPQSGKDISHYDCADALMPVLTIQNGQLLNQSIASTDKVANEVQAHRQESVAVGAMAVQRATQAVQEALEHAPPSIQLSLPWVNGNHTPMIGKD